MSKEDAKIRTEIFYNSGNGLAKIDFDKLVDESPTTGKFQASWSKTNDIYRYQNDTSTSGIFFKTIVSENPKLLGQEFKIHVFDEDTKEQLTTFQADQNNPDSIKLFSFTDKITGDIYHHLQGLNLEILNNKTVSFHISFTSTDGKEHFTLLPVFIINRGVTWE